jgi:hypothetical protein
MRDQTFTDPKSIAKTEFVTPRPVHTLNTMDHTMLNTMDHAVRGGSVKADRLPEVSEALAKVQA